MHILVMLEESPGQSSMLAHVNSVPSALDAERRSRDVITLYGVPSVQALSLALAGLVESLRVEPYHAGIVRHLGIWSDRGAVGDAAWRDASNGRLVSRDLTISIERLQATAADLLSESGTDLRRLVAGLQMADWPEGTRRAISFSLSEPVLVGASAEGGDGGGGGGDDGGGGGGPDLLETYRSSAGLTYDNEGD